MMLISIVGQLVAVVLAPGYCCYCRCCFRFAAYNETDEVLQMLHARGCTRMRVRDGSDHRPRFTIRPAAELTRFTPSVRVLFKAICVVIKVGNILEHSDITLIAVFLLLYASATITFCFLLSSFFSKASNAAAGAGILWFVSYVPSFYVNRSYPSLTLGEKQGYCFILNTCMTLGANIVSQQEGNGVGVTWATVADPISIDDSFRFGSVLMMLLVDAIVVIEQP